MTRTPAPFRLAETVLFEDDHLLAIAKPAGLATLDERGSNAPNLLGLVRAKYPGIQVCHRLDKPTTGVLLCAKHPEAYRAMALQFEARAVEKVYHALVNGAPPYEEGIAVTAPLGTNRNNLGKVDFAKGKPAETRFRVEEQFATVALVAAKPISGRRHQIRLHAAYTGHPLVGDKAYGGNDLKLSAFKRGYKGDRYEEQPLNHDVLLHASSLRFAHPISGEEIVIEAPLADNFSACLKVLRRWGHV